jgi:predicted RNA-binding protein with PUA-like domain
MPAKKKSSAAARHWLVKSEPAAYSWCDLMRDGRTAWTGVRNYQARINLNAMRPGDHVLFYESMTTTAVVGLTAVTRAAFPDTTADEPGWVAVELRAVTPFAHAVTLTAIKAEPALARLALLRQSRLSVTPLTPEEFAVLLRLGS